MTFIFQNNDCYNQPKMKQRTNNDQLSLDDQITDCWRLTPAQDQALNRLGLKTLRDLLFYFPQRYSDTSSHKPIGELQVGDSAIISGKIEKIETKKAHFKKIPMAEALISDDSGKIKAVWFHQPYLAKKLIVGEYAVLSGKVAKRQDKLYLTNPEISGQSSWYDRKKSLFAGAMPELGAVPIYPETRGLSSAWFYYHIKKLLVQGLAETLNDPLPEKIIGKYHLPKLSTALVWIHKPRRPEDAQSAKKRFAFDEVFFLQIERQLSRRAYRSHPSFSFSTPMVAWQKFLSRFPFPLTGAQDRTIKEIFTDFSQDRPMARLIEGDVGSGKTAVAAGAAFSAVMAGYEVAYMVPTEILARQHFESFIAYFAHLNIQVGLLTGTECRKFPSKISPQQHTHISRSTLLKWLSSGQIPIVVGTQALIQKTVKFKDLALVIIDEQHRFGVMQRAKLVRRSQQADERLPHLLSMTATPIPRTLALTIYGDLDLSLLDEMPQGRKPIVTEIISTNKRAEAYEKIRAEIKSGRQAYIICPRIDEPDPDKELALQVKSAKAEAKRLQEKIFPEFKIGLVHSKLKPKDKEAVMAEFISGQLDILVATSVIEVGVNVPNATVIAIEGAERFGLAQLHQLRGRVWRSNHQAYCFIFSDTSSTISHRRLKALTEAKNGFDLAELDLSLRGAGSLSGEKQWGLSDLGMEALRNIKMVELARQEAEKIVATDPELKNYPLIKERLTTRSRPLHLE